MNDAAAPVIDKSVLRGLTVIGKGGQGRVWATDSVRLNGSWPAVYKEYDDTILSRLDADLLRAMVAFVPGLRHGTGEWLCEQAAWPAALVRDGGTVRGFLMRRIPPEFEAHLPQRDGSHQRKAAGFQYLLNPDDYLARMAIPIDDRKRLLLLAHLASTLAEFHRLGIVVGDLSPNNLLFNLSDEPRCFFIDCDAMRLHGASVVNQTETPDWEVPTGEPLATPASDAYKFGLLAIRLFARDQSSRDHTALGRASAELAALAVRSQGSHPASRPSPADWIAALHTAAATVPTLLPVAAPPVNSGLSRGPTIVLPPPRSPAPPASRGIVARIAVTIAIIVALTCLVVVIANLASADDNGSAPLPGPVVTEAATVPPATDEPATDEPATDEPATGPASEDATPPTAKPTAGIVDYSAVADDADGPVIAQMFGTYFDAVNQADWTTALRAYDPRGVVDNGDTGQRAKFRKAMSTTRDSDAAVLSVTGSGDGTLAQLSFTSEQSPGYGPPQHRDQTCTRWSIVYQLTYSESSGYRILKAQSADSSPC
jgi:eukaryotic-like serine/threonine-protein kinase